jgi:hypothetical protein
MKRGLSKYVGVKPVTRLVAKQPKEELSIRVTAKKLTTWDTIALVALTTSPLGLFLAMPIVLGNLQQKQKENE